MPKPTSREPYEKPSVTVIDVQALLDSCLTREGKLYARFNSLADRFATLLDQLVAAEVELQGLSEEVDRVLADLQKVKFALEVAAGGTVQGQG